MLGSQSLVIFAAFAVTGAIVTVLRGWKSTAVVILLWSTFDALPRRYWINDVAWTLGKDVLLAFVYVGYLLQYKTGIGSGRPPKVRLGKPASVSLACLAGWLVVSSFSPRAPSLAVSVYGLWVWLWHLPLLWIGAACFKDQRALWSFLRMYMLVGTAPVVLGVVQALLPIDHILNRTYLPYIPLVGERLRVASTFASNSAFSDYLLFLSGVIFALVLAGKVNRLSAYAFGIGIALAVAATAQVLLLLGLVLLFGTVLVTCRERRAFFFAFGLALVLVSAIVASGYVPAYAVGYGRLSRAWDTLYVYSRLTDHLLSPLLQASREAVLVGYGPGYSSSGLGYLPAGLGIEVDWEGVESGYGKVALELGLSGLVVFITFVLGLLWTVATIRPTDPALRAYKGVVLGWVVALAIWLAIFPKLDQPQFAIPFWFFTGVFLGTCRGGRALPTERSSLSRNAGGTCEIRFQTGIRGWGAC